MSYQVDWVSVASEEKPKGDFSSVWLNTDIGIIEGRWGFVGGEPFFKDDKPVFYSGLSFEWVSHWAYKVKPEEPMFTDSPRMDRYGNKVGVWDD